MQLWCDNGNIIHDASCTEGFVPAVPQMSAPEGCVPKNVQNLLTSWLNVGREGEWHDFIITYVNRNYF